MIHNNNFGMNLNRLNMLIPDEYQNNIFGVSYIFKIFHVFLIFLLMSECHKNIYCYEIYL